MAEIPENYQKAKLFLQTAKDWVQNSANPAVADNSKLKRQIDYALFRHARLEDAADAPMSVGVYGASQAGKSYFVSALAAGKGKSVGAKIGSRVIDFLTEINPSGGQESTGLVTRFTSQPQSVNDAFPIKISLLNELDLVKIMTNSFYEDLEPDAEIDLDACLERANKILDAQTGKATCPYGVEDLVDLGFYCDKHFANHKYYGALKQAGYWARIENIIPQANLHTRQKLYSLLWDGSAPYDRMFQQLTNQLEKFAGADHIYCEASALFDINGDEWVRSPTSVINVSALESIGSGAEKPIRVIADGKASAAPIMIGVGALSALAAEITISIANQPHDFFSAADLLDFPGARSRHAIMRQKFEEAKHLPTDHFLRGKVAYLFEKYCNNFGLSALLLCVGPSNQEVVGLNRLIEDWVSDAIGARPDQRDGQPVSLFAVLTKFDTEFSMDAGKAVDASRWSTRLSASLKKPFGGQQSARTNWLDQWDKSSSFKNTYWWRSPSADQPGLIEYGPNRTEAAILGSRKAEIQEFRNAYLNSDLVQQYFRDPTEAWDAALTLNDGGADYIVTNLAKVCRRDVRMRQIDAQFVNNVQTIASHLRNFYVSGNSDEVLAAKRKLAHDFLAAAGNMINNQSAGDFIAELVLEEDIGISAYEEIRSDIQWGRQRNAGSNETARNSAAFAMLGLPQDKKPAVASANRNETLVRSFVTYWAARTRDKFRDARKLDQYGIDAELIEAICAETVTGFERSGGLAEIARKLERQNSMHESEATVWKSATIMTTLMNDFIVYTAVGTERGRDVARPDDAKVRIFENSRMNSDKVSDLNLSSETQLYAQHFLAHWALGFYDMIKQNASIDIRDEKLIDENNRLGTLLEIYPRNQVH